MDSDADLDPAAIQRLRRLGGDKFTGEMVTLFINYAAEKIAEARKAEQSGDLPGVEKAVHPIKSSAGNVGAVRVQRLAADAEQLARASNGEAVSALLDELEAAYGAVRSTLETQLGEKSGNSTASD